MKIIASYSPIQLNDWPSLNEGWKKDSPKYQIIEDMELILDKYKSVTIIDLMWYKSNKPLWGCAVVSK